MTDVPIAIQPAPPIIDTFGNINIQGRTGQVFAIQIAGPDGITPINISSFSYLFEIAGYASIPLTIGTDVTTQTLTLPNGVFGIPLNTPTPWVLKDITNPTFLAIRNGLLTLFGFEVAPP